MTKADVDPGKRASFAREGRIQTANIAVASAFLLGGCGIRHEPYTAPEIVDEPEVILGSWIETGEAGALADVFDSSGQVEIASRGGRNVHATFSPIFQAPTELYAEVFTGELAAGGVGVGLASELPEVDSYDRLRTWKGAAWDLNEHPDADYAESGAALPVPADSEWWALRLRLADGTLSARAWRFGEVEPEEWTTATSSRDSGRVFLWSYGDGGFRWRALEVDGLALEWVPE